MELVINEGHLVASSHPSWSPFGRECSSPLPGMGMCRQITEASPCFRGGGVVAFSPTGLQKHTEFVN